MEKGSEDKEKLEDKLLSKIPGKEDIEAAIKTWDVIKFLANLFPLVTVICVVFGLRTGDLLWAYIFGSFTLILLVLTAGVYVNNKARGWIKYLPPCHDFLLNLKYCSRHKGFYAGLVVGSVLEGAGVWSWATSLVHAFIPPGVSSLALLALASLLPLHGVFTKRGMKSKNRTKFVSAFVWSLVLFLAGHVFYADIMSM